MFRFTIRDLLWLTVVVALGGAWWVDRRRLEQEIDRLAPKEYAMFSEVELITKDAPAPNRPKH